MNFKKTKVAVASGLMVASMVLAPLSAYAAHDNNGDAGKGFNKVYIKKIVNVADGVTIAGNIHFSVTQVKNLDGITAPNEKEDGSFDEISDLAEGYRVITNGKTNASDEEENEHKTGDFTYVEETEMDFSQLTKAGEYSFVVEELHDGDDCEALVEVNDSNKYGWTFDSNEYLVRVYVKNDENHTKTYTMQKGTYDKEKGTWAKAAGTDGAKDDTAAFTNTFTKKGGSDVPDEEGNVTSLKVSKVVANVSYADLTKPFNFTIKFEADQNSPAQVPEQILHSGEVENSWKAVEGEKNKYTFQLMYDGEISFTDLPAGIHYTVTEGTFANKDTTSNVATSNNIGEQNSSETTGKLLVGEKTNSAEFTNTFRNITITGVVTHSAPFVIMVGALFVAVGGYVVLKKRIEE